MEAVPRDVDTVVFPNYESMPERADVEDPFTEVRLPACRTLFENRWLHRTICQCRPVQMLADWLQCLPLRKAARHCLQFHASSDVKQSLLCSFLRSVCVCLSRALRRLRCSSGTMPTYSRSSTSRCTALSAAATPTTSSPMATASPRPACRTVCAQMAPTAGSTTTGLPSACSLALRSSCVEDLCCPSGTCASHPAILSQAPALPEATTFHGRASFVSQPNNYAVGHGRREQNLPVMQRMHRAGADHCCRGCREVTSESSAVLHYTFTRFSDLKARRDRCDCAPTEEDAKRCFILPFDRMVCLRSGELRTRHPAGPLTRRLRWQLCTLQGVDQL